MAKKKKKDNDVLLVSTKPANLGFEFSSNCKVSEGNEAELDSSGIKSFKVIFIFISVPGKI